MINVLLGENPGNLIINDTKRLVLDLASNKDDYILLLEKLLEYFNNPSIVN